MILGKRHEFTIANHQYRRILPDSVGFSWNSFCNNATVKAGFDVSILEALWGLDAWDEYRFFHFDGEAQGF